MKVYICNSFNKYYNLHTNLSSAELYLYIVQYQKAIFDSGIEACKGSSVNTELY